MSYIMYGECATVKSRFGIVVLQQYDIFAPLLPESNIVPPPSTHDIHDGVGGNAIFCKSIFYFGRHLLVDMSGDKAVPLQLA